MTVAKQFTESSIEPAPKEASPFPADLVMLFPRAYYAFLGLLEAHLEQAGLHQKIRPGMGQVLFRLYERDDRIIKDLAESTLLAHATLTGLLRRMEKSGLVACRSCPDDGRAVRVRLTSKARALQPRLRAFHAQLAAEVESGLSPGDVAAAKRILSTVLHNMRAAESRLRPAPPLTPSRPARRR
jgi:DNA-binding MarR family transcriptional regulator